jgi:putative flavoprotein involved in K+ transport
MDAPPDDTHSPELDPRVIEEPIVELDLDERGVTTVIWATGFVSDFSWAQVPVFDGAGRPMHQRGVTACPGLYFLGLRFLYKWKSSFIFGVGDDAQYLAEQLG